MSRDNPIQFAIVREDPRTELAVLDALLPGPRRVLLVASGGCTALTLLALRPSLSLTLLDANAAQLDLVEWKFRALKALPPGSAERDTAFGVDVDDSASFSGCGKFESLFRGLRGVLDDLVMRAQAPLPLLHVQHGVDVGADVDSGVGGLEQARGHTTMWCTPRGSLLAVALSTRGVVPMASATVAHHRLGGVDCEHLDTSEI